MFFTSYQLILTGVFAICVRCNDISRLTHDLIVSIDPHILPQSGDDGPLVCEVGMSLRQLVKLESKRQILTTSMWVHMTWVDSNLTWVPDDYSGITMVNVPYDKIWTPDFVLYDNTDIEYRSLLESVDVHIKNDGTVFFEYPGIYRTMCLLDIYFYPFDEQICKLRLGSWTYDRTQLDFQLSEIDAADIKYYKRNSEWSLVNFTAQRSEYFNHACCEEKFVDVEFSMSIRRQALMLFFYLYFPNILINIISTFQFLLPCDCTEKVTLCITILLAMIVYLLLMADMLPMTYKIPIIVNYMATTLALVTVSMVFTIFVLEIHHNGQHDNHSQLPHWARKYLLHGLAKLLCMDKYITSDFEHEIKLQAQTSHITLVSDDEDEQNLADRNEKSNDSPMNTTPIFGPKVMTPQASPMMPDIQTPSEPKMKRFNRGLSTSSNMSNIGFLSPGMGGFGNRNKSMAIKRGDLKQNRELLLLKILKHCEEFSERLTEQDKDQELACEWQQLAMVIDRLMLFIYAFITFFVWIYVFTSKPNYSNDIVI